LNRHDIAAADRYFAENLRQFKQFLSGFFQRFPDSHTTIDHILAQDDKVLVIMTGTATDNQTDKRVTIKAADLFRIENGTIAEHWDVVEATGLPDRKVSEP
jgi:predicted SnoaL-like aldol condensation-catalyzing enzyme